jgi:hypothetical protein
MYCNFLEDDYLASASKPSDNRKDDVTSHEPFRNFLLVETLIWTICVSRGYQPASSENIALKLKLEKEQLKNLHGALHRIPDMRASLLQAREPIQVETKIFKLSNLTRFTMSVATHTKKVWVGREFDVIDLSTARGSVDSLVGSVHM